MGGLEGWTFCFDRVHKTNNRERLRYEQYELRIIKNYRLP
jgi:hypothetical protein